MEDSKEKSKKQIRLEERQDGIEKQPDITWSNNNNTDDNNNNNDNYTKNS